MTAMTDLTLDIHPESKLGKLCQIVESTRQANDAVTNERRTYAAEVVELDAWLDAADATTKPQDYAHKWARRSILLNLMRKLEQQITTGMQALRPQEQRYNQLMAYYEENRVRLESLNDVSHPITRILSLNEIEKSRRDLVAWFELWTQPETSVGEDNEQ